MIQALLDDNRLLMVSEHFAQEASTKLAEKCAEAGVTFDALGVLRAFMHRRVSIVENPQADALSSAVHNSDRPLVFAARHYGASVLTDDLKLVYQARASGVDAQFSWGLLSAIRPETLDEELFRIGPLRRERGCIFARVRPAGWAGLSNVGSFAVFDARDFGALLFDTSSLSWIFRSETGLAIKLPVGRPLTQTEVVCVCYQQIDGRISITVRASDLTKSETADPQQRPPSAVQPFMLRNGQHHWNGTIRHFTTGPHTVDRHKWKLLCKLEDGAPNPGKYEILARKLVEWNRSSAGFRSLL